jgi:hypothetical protein
MDYEFNKYVKNFLKEGQRRGSAIMKTIEILDKELYNKIKGTGLDCYYSMGETVCNDVIALYKDRKEKL